MSLSRRILGISAAAGLVATFAITPSASAGMDNLCNWKGNVIPLMEKADRQVLKVDVAAALEPYFGPDLVAQNFTRREVDLKVKPGATSSPTSAKTLTDNYVTYNFTVVMPTGNSTIESVQMHYAGLCWRDEVVAPEPWVGSTGTDKPLKVSANKALKLAQQYRTEHQQDFPLDEPLDSMNLMQSTTAPPDFGKLRWYVNYDNGPGLTILAVYMDGSVEPIRVGS